MSEVTIVYKSVCSFTTNDVVVSIQIVTSALDTITLPMAMNLTDEQRRDLIQGTQEVEWKSVPSRAPIVARSSNPPRSADMK